MTDWTSSDTCDIVNTMAAGNGWITPVRLSAECYDKHFAIFYGTILSLTVEKQKNRCIP